MTSLESKEVLDRAALSHLIVILAAEMLAKAFRKNENVRGIFVNKKEIKISQYADDTTLILDGPKNSLPAFLKLLYD